MTETTGIAAGRVPLFLAIWGLGMVVGDIVGGWLADRALVPAIFGIPVWIVVSWPRSPWPRATRLKPVRPCS